MEIGCTFYINQRWMLIRYIFYSIVIRWYYQGRIEPPEAAKCKMLLNIDCAKSLIRDSELMLKRRASLLRFLCILGQAGVLGELGELLTDQSDYRHKIIY